MSTGGYGLAGNVGASTPAASGENKTRRKGTTVSDLIGPQMKSFPQHLWSLPLSDLAQRRPALSEFHLPLVTLDESALSHNLATMANWCQQAGVEIAPHGKTTMSPQLWHRQLAAGAWGITLATAWQGRIAAQHGVGQVMIANTLADPREIRWAAAQSQNGARVLTWVDNPRSLELIETALADSPGLRLEVLVELGAAGGRTGVRGVQQALALAEQVAASGRAVLAGVSGYEGAVPTSPDAAPSAAVTEFLISLRQLHQAIVERGLYGVPTPILSAGGSAYMDLVAAELTQASGARQVVIRSGAYLIHDDGLYREVSPFGQVRAEASGGHGPRLRSAMHGWAQVVSTPEPDLVICNAGKRDFSFDEGLPQPQLVLGWAESDSQAQLAKARVHKLNDQHLFVELAGQRSGSRRLQVGDVIRFGLSHPCTVLDKWRVIPVLEDATVAAPTVVGALPLYF